MSRRTWIIAGIAVGLLLIYFVLIKPTLSSSMPSDRDQTGLKQFEADKARLPRR